MIKCFFLKESDRKVSREIFDGSGKSLGISEEPVYIREDTGAELFLRDAPVGSIYYADWYDDLFVPQKAHVVCVETPGGVWIVDSQASNCGIPEDHRQEHHHCWIIEGEIPYITVTKNGKTCSAGAGSIQCGNWHGFLKNGYLVT